jgi:4-hydroxyphenylacetaldehyde oxime monooxygenase
MSEIIKNPRVMSKVQAEIRSSVSGKPRVQVSDTPQLKYLRMVIKETLRLHPPEPFLIPRETTQHVQLLGYDLPPKQCFKSPAKIF